MKILSILWILLTNTTDNDAIEIQLKLQQTLGDDRATQVSQCLKKIESFILEYPTGEQIAKIIAFLENQIQLFTITNSNSSIARWWFIQNKTPWSYRNQATLTSSNYWTRSTKPIITEKLVEDKDELPEQKDEVVQMVGYSPNLNRTPNAKYYSPADKR